MVRGTGVRMAAETFFGVESRYLNSEILEGSPTRMKKRANAWEKCSKNGERAGGWGRVFETPVNGGCGARLLAGSQNRPQATDTSSSTASLLPFSNFDCLD